MSYTSFRLPIDGIWVSFFWRAPFWQMQFTHQSFTEYGVQSRRIKKSTKQEDPEAAQRTATRFIARLRGVSSSTEISIEELVGQWLSWQVRNGKKSERTARADLIKARHTIAWLNQRGVYQVKQLNRDVGEKMKDHLVTSSRSPKTADLHLSRMKAATRWAARQDLIDRDPFEKIEQLPRKMIKAQGGVRNYTDEELYAIFGQLRLEPEPVRAAIYVAMFGGLRREEITALRCRDVQRHGDFTLLFVRARKSPDDRHVPIPETVTGWIPEATAIAQLVRDQVRGRKGNKPLFMYPEGKELEAQCFSRRVTKLVRRLGIPVEEVGKPLHAFRHTLSTYMQNQIGVPRDVVKKQFGWTNDQTAQVYTHTHLADLEAAVARLEAS